MRYFKFLLVPLLLISSVVQAQVPVDFYSASVAVESRDSQAFKLGLREALVQVLSKVAGVPADAVRMRSSLALELSQGELLASQFAYYQQTQNGQPQLRIKASFQESKIMALLQKGGLSFWSPERAPLAVWIITQENNQLAWLNNRAALQTDFENWQKNAVLYWGGAVDFTQPQAVDTRRLWYWDTLYMQSLQTMMNSAVAVIRVQSATQASVSLLADNDNLSVHADNLPQLIEKAISTANLQRAKTEAVQLLSTDSEVALHIENVNDYPNYEAVMRYLADIDTVKELHVLALDKQTLSLAISFQTRLAQLEKKLLDDGYFVTADQGENTHYQLNLRWVGQ